MSCSPFELTFMAIVAGALAGVATLVLVGLLHTSSKRGSAKEPEIVRFMCNCCGELKVSGPTEYNQQRKPLCMSCGKYLSSFQRQMDNQRHRR